MQSLTDGVIVEQPLVQRGRVNAVGKLAVFVNERRLIRFLVLVGKVVVAYVLLQKL